MKIPARNGTMGPLRPSIAVLSVPVLALGLLAATRVAAFEAGVIEVEPNDTPAEATPVTAPAVIMGSMAGDDQDAYLWKVSDVDAGKRWTLELDGIPGQLTIVEILRVELAENGVDVTGYDRLMKMGTRDGSKPSIVENLMFEPGDYVLGVAHAGGGGIFRPPAATLSFGGEAQAEDAAEADQEPGGYRLAIREGTRVPAGRKLEAHAARDDAQSLRLGTEAAGFIAAKTSWYALEFGTQDAEQRWDVQVQAPVGRELRASLHDGDGKPLANAASDRRGRLAFRDLAPPAGTWFLEIDGAADSGFVQAVDIEPAGVRVEGSEAEPNDNWKLANRVDLGQPLSGRTSAARDTDFFRFVLDEATTDQALSLQLEAADASSFELCLLDSGGKTLQCRTNTGGVDLPGLVLTPGEWGLSVGHGSDNADYTVTLSGQGPIPANFEAEPNDALELASSVPAKNVIKGVFSGDDSDYYKFTVVEQPQLWRFQVMGDGIEEVGFYDSAAKQTQRVRPAKTQHRVRLENVFLLPGTHHLLVRGKDGGSYTLLARALGAPDPNGEREPNDDPSRTQPLRFGQTRTGLLEDKDDEDYYRFSLDDWDRIRLTITPPTDGSVFPYLYWYGTPFRSRPNGGVGEAIALSGLFPPGNYAVRLSANQTSEAEYKIHLERLARFGCPTDCEPNDNVDFANPLPATMTVEGRAGEWRDDDVYALPVFDKDTGLRLTASGVVKVAELRDAPSLVELDREAGVYTGTIPAGTQTYAFVGGNARTPDYRLAFEFAGGPKPSEVPPDPPLALSLDLDAKEVAAYRQYGQEVEATLRITNNGSSPVTVNLETATSDHRWRFVLDQDRATITAGATTSVAARVLVPEDAWADKTVRVSVRARDAVGGQIETSAEVSPGRDTVPIDPVRAWTLPEPLLGGFNAARDVLGGRWTGEPNSAVGKDFPLLFDGMAADGQFVALRGWKENESRAATVELAGGKPVDVVGIAVNLLGGPSVDYWLRNIDFSVSLDGKAFTPVLSDNLLPIRTEQAFVLGSPVPARFARLTFRDSFNGAPRSQLNLGEFKVIIKPGTDLSNGRGFNLADPALGGHIVWAKPDLSTRGLNTMLVEGGELKSVRPGPGESFEWVVGFQHDRAAELNRLEWVDSPKDPERHIKHVTLSASLDSPIGPWIPLGEWQLDDTSPTQVFRFEHPVWARFLKFSSAPVETRRWLQAPATLRAWERPTDDEYRSVLTEWGYASQAAYYEASHAIETEKPFQPAGNDSREQAAALELDTRAAGQVRLSQQAAWYRLHVPERKNTLSISVGGDPTVRTVVFLENEAGEPIPARESAGASTPQLHVYESIVEPGGTYYLRVEEPPRNLAFLWDTSPSVAPYINIVYNAMISYAADLVPGRDAANFIPFGGSPLLRDWYGEPYILQMVLNDYARNDNSSAAETTLAMASKTLAPRAGTKAIIVVTDAATTKDASVWDEFKRVHPRVFGLGVSSAGAFNRDPPTELDLFQDWSRVNGGHYAYATDDGEMEVAFDRAATMLRRPAGYTLRVSAAYKEAPGPGRLFVVRKSQGAPASKGSAASGAVELILDASGSMLKHLEGKRRIEMARDVLSQAVNEYIALGTPVALRVFGNQEPNACRTDLEVPLAPLDPAALSNTLAGVEAKNLAKTPIADSLALIESDLADAKGRKVVVLVTDGEETCDGDPAAVIEALQEKGFDISLNIVGFAIDDAALEQEFERWAELGGGRYFSATDQAGLSEGIAAALRVPFTVYDTSGDVAASGVVDGEPVELDPALYRVVVSGSTPKTFDRVEIPGASATRLETE
jgi:von Willebrand factor type A domain